MSSFIELDIVYTKCAIYTSPQMQHTLVLKNKESNPIPLNIITTSYYTTLIKSAITRGGWSRVSQNIG